MSKKCSTDQRFILTEVTTYRIGTLVGTQSSKCYTFSESSPTNVHSEIEEYLFEVVEKFRKGMHLGFPVVRIPSLAPIWKLPTNETTGLLDIGQLAKSNET